MVLSKDTVLRLWDGQTGEALAVLEGHTQAVRGALLMPDGRILSWSNDNTLRLWDGRTGTTLAVLEGHTNWIEDAQLMPDGRILSWDHHTLHLWDSQTGHCLEQSGARWVEDFELSLPDELPSKVGWPMRLYGNLWVDNLHGRHLTIVHRAEKRLFQWHSQGIKFHEQVADSWVVTEGGRPAFLQLMQGNRPWTGWAERRPDS